MVKAVIFDMDGVLIDTEKWLTKYWCQAAGEAGFPMEMKHALAIRSLAGKYAEQYLQGIFGDDFSYWEIRERRKELMREHLKKHGVEKKQGADELLDYLREHKIKTAVATATDFPRTRCYLTANGFYYKFDENICGSLVENGKPKPDIYLYACKRLGLTAGECIAVEDSPNGVRSASSAGLRTIMVPDLTEPDEEIKKLIAAKAHSLYDVILMMEDHAAFL